MGTSDLAAFEDDFQHIAVGVLRPGEAQRRVLSRMLDQRHPGHRCVPSQPQRCHASGDPTGVAKDAAASRKDQVGAAGDRLGGGGDQPGLPRASVDTVGHHRAEFGQRRPSDTHFEAGGSAA